MHDYGNEAAEKAIKKLDKRIQDVYKEAEQDLQKKMDEFVRKYKIKEQKYLEQVAEGKISQADFDAWKQGQVFQGRQWRTKQRSIADVLYRSGEVSTKIINEMALGVCAENVNWAAYTIEHGFGVDFGFNLYDETTVANLIKKEPDILPKWKIEKEKNYIWNKKKLNNAVTQGIIQGEKLNEIAKRVAVGLSGSDQKLMKTFAKTAMTGAQNSGRNISYKNAQKLGINLKKEWLATLDMRTRSSHRKLDGKKADIDEPFESEYGEIMYPGDPSANPADVYNCFVGETIVSADSKIVRSYKHEYIGELITIKTSRGVEFTCTPNHPILTPRGWVGAALLNNGDDIVVTSIGNRINSRWDPDVKHIHSRIDTLHKFGDIFGGHRTCALNVDFHGDIPTSDVEIVTHKGLLRNGRNVGGCKSVNKFLLKITDKAFTSQSAFVKHFWGVCLSTLGFICRRSKALAFFLRRLAHPNIHGFGAVPNMNSVFSENAVDDLSADAVVGGKLLNGLPGNVFIDNIIGVNKVVSNCHVYNLQTENNYYFVNSIAQNGEKSNGIYAIAHNCRCTMAADLVDYPAEEYERYDNIEGKPIKGMSYEEWAKAKKNGEDITPQKKIIEQRKETTFRTLLESAQKLKSAMPGDDFEEFAKLIDENPEDAVRFLYDKYSDECKSYSYRGKTGGAYSRAYDNVDFSFNDNNGRSRYSTLAHEMSHMFDSHIADAPHITFKEIDLVNKNCSFNGSQGAKIIRNVPSSSDQFLLAMREDKKKLDDYVKDRDLLDAFNRDNSTVGIQDLLDGLYGTQAAGLTRWGHGEKYYNRNYSRRIKGYREKELRQTYLELGFDASNQNKCKRIMRQYETAGELWANVGSALVCGGEELEMMRKYCPNSVNAYLNIVKGLM